MNDAAALSAVAQPSIAPFGTASKRQNTIVIHDQLRVAFGIDELGVLPN